MFYVKEIIGFCSLEQGINVVSAIKLLATTEILKGHKVVFLMYNGNKNKGYFGNNFVFCGRRLVNVDGKRWESEQCCWKHFRRG